MDFHKVYVFTLGITISGYIHNSYYYPYWLGFVYTSSKYIIYCFSPTSVKDSSTSSEFTSNNEASATIFYLKKIIESDASIKHKDVKTNDNGQYLTRDNILILSILYRTDSLQVTPVFYGYYSIYYYNKSDITTTLIVFYKSSSYIDHDLLNDYINNRDENTKIYVYQNRIDYSIPIRLYYI